MNMNMNRTTIPYRNPSYDHEATNHAAVQDLPTIFSSLEIAPPSIKNDQQEQILMNALRTSLNLGTNVDDAMYKEMAEAMIRCKMRCVAEEQERTREKMHRMHIQDENYQMNGSQCKTGTSQGVSTSYGDSINREKIAATTAAASIQSQHENTDTSYASVESVHGKNKQENDFSSPRMVGRNGSDFVPTESSAPQNHPNIMANEEIFHFPLPPYSPWPGTAPKVQPTPFTSTNEAGTKAASVPMESTSTPQNVQPGSAELDAFFGVPPPRYSPWPDTAQKAQPTPYTSTNEADTKAASVSMESTSTPQNCQPGSAELDAFFGVPPPPYSPWPDTAQKFQPTPMDTENSANINERPSAINTEYTTTRVSGASAEPPSSSIPYTPVASSEAFKEAMMHGQHHRINGFNHGGDFTSKIKTPTLLFKPSPFASNMDRNTREDESPVGKAAATNRTVRFEIGTKVKYLLIMFGQGVTRFSFLTCISLEPS